MIEEVQYIVRPSRADKTQKEIECFGFKLFMKDQITDRGQPAIRLTFNRDNESQFYDQYRRLFEKYKILQMQYDDLKKPLKFSNKWIVPFITVIGALIFLLAKARIHLSNNRIKKRNFELDNDVSVICQEGKALVRLEQKTMTGDSSLGSDTTEIVKIDKESLKVENSNYEDISSN